MNVICVNVFLNFRNCYLPCHYPYSEDSSVFVLPLMFFLFFGVSCSCFISIIHMNSFAVYVHVDNCECFLYTSSRPSMQCKFHLFSFVLFFSYQLGFNNINLSSTVFCNFKSLCYCKIPR